MALQLIRNLSHPLLFRRGWIVKLPEPLPQEPEHRIAGALVYLRELEPLVVGEALDCWQPQELVGVEVVVAGVAADAVPPRGRPGRGRGRGRGRRRRLNPSPTPWTPPRPSQQATPRGSWTPGRSHRTLNQADLQRRLRMLFQDQEQLAQGREIANVTMSNSIVTSYKHGGPPRVRSSSSR